MRTLSGYCSLVCSLVQLPADVTQAVAWTDVYRNQLRRVRTSGDLLAFTARWKSVWQIPSRGRWTPSSHELAIAEGSYEPGAAMRCMGELRTGLCKHCAGPEGDCVGAHIGWPALLVKCEELAVKVGSTPNRMLLGIVRHVLDDLTN